MKKVKPLPLDPGQTDLFGDPSFAGVASARGAATVEVSNIGKDRVPLCDHSVECFTMRAAPAGGKSPAKKPRHRDTSKKPVAVKMRRKGSRKAREDAAAKQAKHRALKRKIGLQLLELWVPGAVKSACRSAAKREKTTMDLKGGAVLAAAFGLLARAPGKGTP